MVVTGDRSNSFCFCPHRAEDQERRAKEVPVQGQGGPPLPAQPRAAGHQDQEPSAEPLAAWPPPQPRHLGQRRHYRHLYWRLCGRLSQNCVPKHR